MQDTSTLLHHPTLTNGTQPTLRESYLNDAKPRNQSTSAKRTLLSENGEQSADPAAGSHCPAGRSVSIHQEPRTCWHCVGDWQVVIPVRRTQASGEGKQVNK